MESVNIGIITASQTSDTLMNSFKKELNGIIKVNASSKQVKYIPINDRSPKENLHFLFGEFHFPAARCDLKHLDAGVEKQMGKSDKKIALIVFISEGYSKEEANKSLSGADGMLAKCSRFTYCSGRPNDLTKLAEFILGKPIAKPEPEADLSTKLTGMSLKRPESVADISTNQAIPKQPEVASPSVEKKLSIKELRRIWDDERGTAGPANETTEEKRQRFLKEVKDWKKVYFAKLASSGKSEETTQSPKESKTENIPPEHGSSDDDGHLEDVVPAHKCTVS